MKKKSELIFPHKKIYQLEYENKAQNLITNINNFIDNLKNVNITLGLFRPITIVVKFVCKINQYLSKLLNIL